MVNAHRNNPEASIISSKYYFTDLQLNIIKECGHGSEIPTQHSYLTMGKGAITHFTSFKTAKYSQTVGINEKFKRAVDQDLYLKLEEVGKHVFINEFFYLYRINENSISANENVFKAAYWHFRAKKDAYYRRKQQKVQVKNFSDEDFIKLANSYYLSRLKRAAKLKRYKSKYYFLFQSILVSCTLDWKYKLRCLIIPNYY
jgi:hypothetical protein